MVDYTLLTKDALVDRLAEFTEQYTHEYLHGNDFEKLNDLRTKVKAIQNEIMHRNETETKDKHSGENSD